MKKIIVGLIIGIFFSELGMAQVVADTLSSRQKSILPHFANLQYAGNMGFLSVGLGYAFSKQKMGLAYQVGYLPESIGGVKLWTTSLKYFWSPWINEYERYKLKPFVVGLNLITTRAKGIERRWADYYPSGYYPWIPALNAVLHFGSEATYKMKPEKTVNELAFYYEVGWVSRLVELWWDNRKTIGFHEIWNLSLGFRVYFR